MPEEQLDIVTEQNQPTGQVVGSGELPKSADEEDIRVWAKKFIERYRSALEALAKK